ncbi:MAG: xanthine dehydrogenase family protein molybdopterin-binding subunit [Dehalococcoidia bacterium]|nr:xanthine dehydrogenase family protein molybdopterin-binding subunit [Dehalococcoidia bacterium]
MVTETLVGKSIPRIDAAEIVTGSTSYTADILPRGTLFAKLVLSTRAHALIKRIDTSKALAHPGVMGVVTGEDAPKYLVGRFLKDRPMLAQGKVRFVGEPVAAVAAVDKDIAEQAADLIEVEYEDLPAVFDPEEAMGPNAPLVHLAGSRYLDGAQGWVEPKGNIRNDVIMRRGDPDKAFAECDIIYEDTYRTHPTHQGYIEPHAVVASVDSESRITLWASNKGQFIVRNIVSEAFDLPKSQVKVIVTKIGGDFGGKGTPWLECIAVLLSKKTGRPVKLVLSRREDIILASVRHASIIRLKVGAKKDGTLHALKGEIIFECGSYADGGGGMAGRASTLVGSYKIPNVETRGLAIYTNSGPRGHVRAPGAPAPTFAIESHIDMLAKKLEMDPWEFRLKNALGEGDYDPDGHSIMRNVGLIETITKAREYVHREFRRGPNRGIGIACSLWGHAVGPSAMISGAYVRIEDDGRVVLYTGVGDQGAGQRAVLAQIVANELHIQPNQVVIGPTDTASTPFENGSGGSMTTFRAGNSARFAAMDARTQLFEMAAERLEVGQDDLELANGRIHVKGSPDRGYTIAEMARHALDTRGVPILGTGVKEKQELLKSMEASKGIMDGPAFCTQVAEVEVDPETGQVTVLRFLAAHDVGFAINPSSVEGQLQGGVVFGLGYSLTEQIMTSEGRVLNPSLLDYRLLTAKDVPNIEVLCIEVPSSQGPYGAKGVAEPPVIPTAAAIANAVFDAVGVRITEIPINAERVMEALQKSQDGTEVACLS